MNVIVTAVDRAADLAAAWPVYKILLGAMVLDVLTGMAASFGTKTLSSSVCWKGIMRKLATLMVVALAVLLEPIVPGHLALGTLAALGFLVSESLSVLENAGRLGVLPPFLLKDALIKLQQAAPASVRVEAPASMDLRVSATPKDDSVLGGQRWTDPPDHP